MSFQSRLKERREYLNISRAEMAKFLNVTVGAISNYENGISSPKVDLLFKIFEILECDANYLYQDNFDTKDFSCSLEEQNHLKKYRTLDEHGKKAVDTTLINEYDRCTHVEENLYFHDYNKAHDYLINSQIFAMGGINFDKMDDEKVIKWANDFYGMEQDAIKLLGEENDEPKESS